MSAKNHKPSGFRQQAKSAPTGRSKKLNSSEVRWYLLSELLLDETNPRLGKQCQKDKNQNHVLNTIVDVFGIDDVLSSLAVNGYFDAEPLVGIKKGEKILIKEGNRRLAACLILAGDNRAQAQLKRTNEYQRLQNKYQKTPIEKVPVIVHENQSDLLSYLGVRHIAAAQPWDSYAKAAWVAEVIETDDLNLEDVSQMIGDQHRTVARILEGYYLINQLVDSGQFHPSQSMRNGRGSNPEYPFSWVYTALGYKPIRNWLELGDLAEGRQKNPIESSKLDDAGYLLTFLFGNKSKGKQPAINDSREISDLAKAIANPERIHLLKRGKTIDDVASETKPPKDKIGDALYDAQESLRPALVLLTETPINASDALELTKPSKRVKNLASKVDQALRQAALAEAEEDNEQNEL